MARLHGVAEQPVYRWTAKYGGMEVFQSEPHLDLEAANARLTQRLAVRARDIPPSRRSPRGSGDARSAATDDDASGARQMARPATCLSFLEPARLRPLFSRAEHCGWTEAGGKVRQDFTHSGAPVDGVHAGQSHVLG
ncbi:transposase [Halomonas sp. THAF5a]|uniref:transposase n=1 Tax=Halomonas sp. THAF5a TaxID=2587844 RepID=UPI001268B1BA